MAFANSFRKVLFTQLTQSTCTADVGAALPSERIEIDMEIIKLCEIFIIDTCPYFLYEFWEVVLFNT